jgi:hypothetical protein
LRYSTLSPRLLSTLGLLSLLGLFTSCDKPAGLNPVAGKVLFNGEPLSGALVSFHSTAGPLDSGPPVGLSKSDGTFSVATGDVEGAPTGTYKVTIICSETPKVEGGGLSTGGVETRDRLQGKYANSEASQISVTIKEGPNALETFDLK